MIAKWIRVLLLQAVMFQTNDTVMAEPRVSRESWRAALNIFVSKPHSVDKRLAGQETIKSYELGTQINESEFLFNETILLEKISMVSSDESLIKRIDEFFRELNPNEIISGQNTVTLQKHISRKEKVEHYFQLVIKSVNENIIQFVPLNCKNSASYQLELETKSIENNRENDIRVEASDDYDIVIKLSPGCGPRQCDWVRRRLVPRVLGWASSAHNATTQVESVRLVGLEAGDNILSKTQKKKSKL